MPDREKVIAALHCRAYDDDFPCWKCAYYKQDEKPVARCDYRGLMDDAIELLKEQEVRELSIDEWREWKENPKRNPICELWENDTSPMWILDPNRVHEPALLMGKLKLFTGKPTLEQCKAVKWD